MNQIPDVPTLGTLYRRFEPRIRRLPKYRAITERHVIHPRFRLEREGRIEVYYAPMDWLRPSARIAIVGITPGKGTMLISYETAIRGLASGRGAASVLNEVKATASFSGFRNQLISWLDWLEVPAHVGVESSAALWEPAGRHLLQPTSAIRYPVFINGDNYTGSSPRITAHPLFRRYLRKTLAPELAAVPNALVIPLGVRVEEALSLLVDEERLDPERCLFGFPHPSGANGHKGKQWTEGRRQLRRKTRRWFVSHPVTGPDDKVILPRRMGRTTIK